MTIEVSEFEDALYSALSDMELVARQVGDEIQIKLLMWRDVPGAAYAQQVTVLETSVRIRKEDL